MTEQKKKSYKHHINLVVSAWEAEQLEKFCSGYGAKTTLLRALIRRFLKEQGVLTGISDEKGVMKSEG